MFRDNLQALYDREVVVLGVSADDEESHKHFAEKYSLTFPILSDPELSTIELYGVKNENGDGALRQTFLINPAGEIVKRYEDVTPQDHISEILADLEQLQS